MKCLGHPEEFYNLLRFQMGGRRKVIPKMNQVGRASLHPGGAGRLRWTVGFRAWLIRPQIESCSQRCQKPRTLSFPMRSRPLPCQAAPPAQPGSAPRNPTSGLADLGPLGVLTKWSCCLKCFCSFKTLLFR